MEKKFKIVNNGKGLKLKELTKEDYLLIPISPAILEAINDAINEQDVNLVHKTGNETIEDKKLFTLSSLIALEAAVTIKREYSGISSDKVATLTLVNESDTAGGQGYQNEVNLFLKAGLTENWRRYIGILNYDNTVAWFTGGNKQNAWILYDAISGLHRYWNNTIADGGDTYISSAGIGRIYLNRFNDGGTGNGTGGIYVGSGGTNPETVLYIDNAGRIVSPANTTANLRFSQTLGGVFTDTSAPTQGGLYSSVFSSPTVNGSGNITGGTLRVVHNTAFNVASIVGNTVVARSESSGIPTLVVGTSVLIQNSGTATLPTAQSITSGLSTASGNIITNGYCLYIPAPTGAGAITNYRPIRILDGTGTALTYGIQLSIASGTNKYNIYNDGTAPNLFNGPIVSGSTIRLKGYLVSTLPIGVEGDTAYVTDALTPTYSSIVVGGGTVKCRVFFNGTNWIT